MFDISKPFGAVSGHPTGAAYEQNGKLYFANGDPVEVTSDETVEEVSDETVEVTPPAAKVTRRR